MLPSKTAARLASTVVTLLSQWMWSTPFSVMPSDWSGRGDYSLVPSLQLVAMYAFDLYFDERCTQRPSPDHVHKAMLVLRRVGGWLVQAFRNISYLMSGAAPESPSNVRVVPSTSNKTISFWSWMGVTTLKSCNFVCCSVLEMSNTSGWSTQCSLQCGECGLLEASCVLHSFHFFVKQALPMWPTFSQ